MSTTVVPENKARLSKRHWMAAGATLTIVALAVAGARWWTVGRFIEHTDDAYVRADIVTVSARVPGAVASVAVAEGQDVKAGEALAVVEAMKMENVLRAEKDVTIAKVLAKEGDSLAVDAVIMEFA